MIINHNVIALTVEEFIKETRPDGLGHITISDFDGNVEEDITFDDVICDLCNADMETDPEDPGRETVFIRREMPTYAICQECNEQAEYRLKTREAA